MEQNYVTVTLCVRSLIFHIFTDFCQPSYLNIRRTDLHEICTVGRILKVDERPEVIFFDPSREVAPAANFVGGIHTFALLIEVFYCYRRTFLIPCSSVYRLGATTTADRCR